MNKAKKSKLPMVSFIIPTLNASQFLDTCLQAIRSQKYPQDRVEIVIADGGSTDDTLTIANKYQARVIFNKEVLHEPGKALASEAAIGEILFFTDSDNILSHENWIMDMITPYLEYPEIKGFLPQTIPPPNWNSFDRYMGYLATDPFTWFVYRWASVPRTYGNSYKSWKTEATYTIYRFTVMNHPLLGLSQGFGTVAKFKREEMGKNDDILSGIKLIAEGGLIVHVPTCGVYHYHVDGMSQFIKKYTWRIRNNFYQKIKGMGLVNRQKYLSPERRIRQYIFPLYSLSILFPIIDTIKLYSIYRDPVIFWHPIASIVLSVLMLKELLLYAVGIKISPGKY